MNRSRFSPQMIFGLCVIILGVLFILNNLDVIDARSYLRFWPAIFVLVGLVKLLQPGGTPGKVAGAGFLLIGSFLVLDRLDVIDFNVWDLWPAFIILFGFSLVRGAVMRQRSESGGPSGKPQETDSFFKAVALMGGVVRKNDSQDFRGGEITAVMGGCEIDLRQASIKEGEATIEIFAFWGGVEIKVPQDWSVTVRAVPIMGGIEDKTVPPKGGSSKHLVIAGSAIMGGAEIRN